MVSNEIFGLQMKRLTTDIQKMKNDPNYCYYYNLLKDKLEKHSKNLFYSQKLKSIVCERCKEQNSDDSSIQLETILANEARHKEFEKFYCFKREKYESEKYFDKDIEKYDKQIQFLQEKKRYTLHLKSFFQDINKFERKMKKFINTENMGLDNLIEIEQLILHVVENYHGLDKIDNIFSSHVSDLCKTLNISSDKIDSLLSNSFLQNSFFHDSISSHISMKEDHNNINKSNFHNNTSSNNIKDEKNKSLNKSITNANFNTSIQSEEIRNKLNCSNNNNFNNFSTPSEGLLSNNNLNSSGPNPNTFRNKAIELLHTIDENKLVNQDPNIRDEISKDYIDYNINCLYLESKNVYYYNKSERKIFSQEISINFPDSISFVINSNIIHVTGGKIEKFNKYYTIELRQNDIDKTQILLPVKREDMNIARINHSSFIHDDKLYVIGGDGHSEVEYYNPKDKKWVNLPSMNKKRSRCCAMIVNTNNTQFIYAFIGYLIEHDKKLGIDTIERLNLLNKNKWEEIKVDNSKYLKRHFSSLLTENNNQSILICGGNDNRDIIEFNYVNHTIMPKKKMPAVTSFINMNFFYIDEDLINVDINQKYYTYKNDRISEWKFQ